MKSHSNLRKKKYTYPCLPSKITFLFEPNKKIQTYPVDDVILLNIPNIIYSKASEPPNIEANEHEPVPKSSSPSEKRLSN